VLDLKLQRGLLDAFSGIQLASTPLEPRGEVSDVPDRLEDTKLLSIGIQPLQSIQS
jgi:hypothetical protein